MPKRAKRKKKGGEYFNSVKKRREKSSSNTHIHVHTYTHTAYQTDETQVSKSKERLYFVMRNERGIYRLIYIHKRLDL